MNEAEQEIERMYRQSVADAESRGFVECISLEECPDCGADLWPGEFCDCEDEWEEDICAYCGAAIEPWDFCDCEEEEDEDESVS